MGATVIDGPEYVYGNLGNIEGGVLGLAGTTAGAVPDPNSDAGPSMFYQGDGLMDPRVLFLKDKVQGWTGMVQGFLAMDIVESIRAIPSAASATRLVNAVNPAGVAFTLPTTSVNPAFVCSVPVRNFSPVVNGGSVTTYAIALDFGFGWAAAPTIGTTGPWTVDPLKIWDYFVGMPVVIAGTTASIAPLVTFITAVSYVTGTPTFTTAAPNPGFTAAQVCAVGTADLWGPNEASPSTGGYPVPLAASPYLAAGPSLLLDARQTLARTLVYTGVASGSGGTVTTIGADIYGSPMTETITLAAGANVVYGKKAFKYILSVTPNFTDGHGVSVGTSDVFGFAIRSTLYEDMAIFWAAAWDAAATGYLPAILTQPSTALLGDVRGTISVNSGASPAGGSIGSTASNGSLGGTGGLVQAGNRLEVAQQISLAQCIQATQLNPFYLTGVTQV